MGRSLAVTTTLSADDLRKQARRERDGRVSLRLIAVMARRCLMEPSGRLRRDRAGWTARLCATGCTVSIRMVSRACVTARLIEDQHRLRALGDMARDFGQMGAIASVLHCGMTRPAATPRAGQIAPKIWAETVRRSFGAEGPVPRRAQRLVIPVFCPIRASCCHHRSMGVPAPGPARICSSLAGKFFLESAIAPASCA